MSILRVGIAGYGIVGKRRRRCVDENPGLKLIAVCDRNFVSSSPQEAGINFYSSYKELLMENLDILIVCMTNDVAAEVTIAGIKKGLHVFCEKTCSAPHTHTRTIHNTHLKITDAGPRCALDQTPGGSPSSAQAKLSSETMFAGDC